ncbi:hypothetical protein COO60DRAFT_1460810 [Scenedesmus sp. NREL 46B-D3]|nr:hypothetical protein COO60DRAFT_1460810 [Scenedesmus sp. NREL 46B-D3]
MTKSNRSQEARQAEGQQRFSDGYKYDQVLPHTKGLRALALAAMCPALQQLSIDERASCVGGMTNDLARALAVHCRQLSVLEVYFQRYSLPSELFTDDGLIALSERCKGLQQLTLHNCDRISDRSLYAVAANCPGLTAITLGGYNEHVTDGGMTVLFDSCKQLTHVQLSSKLLKVTDCSGASLAANCPHLTSAKLTRAMTDATIRQLALSCKHLRELDLHRSCSVSCEALQGLLEACPQLSKLVLPQQLEVGSMMQAMHSRCCILSMLEEEQLQVLALQH